MFTESAAEPVPPFGRLAVLAGRAWRAEELTGGRSNRTYRVRTVDDNEPVLDLAIRCWQPGSDLLGVVDRDLEQRCSRAAAARGIAPAVVEFDEGLGMLAVEYVADAVALRPGDLDDSAVLTEVATAVRRLHAGPRSGADLDIFAVGEQYRAQIAALKLGPPPHDEEMWRHLARIRSALTADPEPRLACHNDLVPTNLLLLPFGAEPRIRLIDFEHAADNESSFELGNLWFESSTGIETLEALLEAYDGEVVPRRVARARLWALATHLIWPLWASLMAARRTDQSDHDFSTWGERRYELGTAQVYGGGFDRLLAAAA